MQYLRLFFSSGPIASSFTVETNPWSTDLLGLQPQNNLPLLVSHFTNSHNRLFRYFQKPPYIYGQDPSKVSGFMSPHVPTVLFQYFQCVPGNADIPENKHAVSLPKAAASQPTAMVPCPSLQHSPNPLHPVSKMETSHFHNFPSHLNCPVSTVTPQELVL